MTQFHLCQDHEVSVKHGPLLPGYRRLHCAQTISTDVSPPARKRTSRRHRSEMSGLSRLMDSDKLSLQCTSSLKRVSISFPAIFTTSIFVALPSRRTGLCSNPETPWNFSDILHQIWPLFSESPWQLKILCDPYSSCLTLWVSECLSPNRL